MHITAKQRPPLPGEQNNTMPSRGGERYSFEKVGPTLSPNNAAIASLAVQKLAGKEIGTEQAARAMYLFKPQGTTAEQLLADANRMADSAVGQAAKKALEGKDPTRAMSIIGASAETDALVAARSGAIEGGKTALRMDKLATSKEHQPISRPIIIGISLIAAMVYVATSDNEPEIKAGSLIAIAAILFVYGLIEWMLRNDHPSAETSESIPQNDRSCKPDQNSRPRPLPSEQDSNPTRDESGEKLATEDNAPPKQDPKMISDPVPPIKLPGTSESKDNMPSVRSATATAMAQLIRQATTSCRTEHQEDGIPQAPSNSGRPPSDRYSPEEWRRLRTVPWNDLGDDLKIKTIHFHDDPACRERNPDEPIFFPVQSIDPPVSPTPPSTPPTSSSFQRAKIDRSQFDPLIWIVYSPEELEMLSTVPWMDLPTPLKRKTVARGHDPFSSGLNSKNTPFLMHLTARSSADHKSLAPPVPPTPKPASSYVPGAATPKSFTPDPPCLRAGRADMLRALNLIHAIGQPRMTDQVIFSFDGACLHFDLCGMSTSVPAHGQWDCQVRAKPAFLLPLIEVPLEDDTWLIWVKDQRLYFGPSFSCQCELQDPWRATIQLPLNNDDDMLLALRLKYSAQEIEQSGLKHSVSKVEEACVKKVNAAVNALASHEVRAEEIRALVDKHIRASGILKKL